jgi:hypothetical protein
MGNRSSRFGETSGCKQSISHSVFLNHALLNSPYLGRVDPSAFGSSQTKRCSRLRLALAAFGQGKAQIWVARPDVLLGQR